MKDCVFCKIVDGELPCSKVYEDDTLLSFLDINPIAPGHVLVITKAHYDYAHQCPHETMASLATKISTIADAVFQVSGADGYNIYCNNGKAAGQEVPHLHFHIIPRFDGDGAFAKWNTRKYQSSEQMNDICKKLRDKLK
jgi:histidine triad (HIT) family protein